MVGVGVLGLPYSFSYLGWVAGVFALVATLAVSLYTAYLLSALHEEPDGTRHNRYVDLGRAILGKDIAVTLALTQICCDRNSSQSATCTVMPASGIGSPSASSCAVAGDAWAKWLITPLQYSVMIGLAVAYLVTAGQSFQVCCTHDLHSAPLRCNAIYISSLYDLHGIALSVLQLHIM